MASVIFDTNIYIFHFFKYPDVLEVFMSTIQISEFLSYERIDQHPKLKAEREKYISIADEILLVGERIARKAAELRRVWKKHSGKSLKLPDALIAATAILNDTLLISNNDRDFLYLSQNHGLNYDNPIQNQDDLYRFMKEKTG